MGSGCSVSLCDAPPTCDSLPVARKWQQRRHRHRSRGGGDSGRLALSKKTKRVAAGATAHLIASSRVPPGMLYANTAARSADEGKRTAGAPAWMVSHLLLLYNSVPVDDEEAEMTRGGGRTAASEGVPARGAAGSIAATEGTGDVVLSMFHGFFGLAERQRKERVSQLTYPF